MKTVLKKIVLMVLSLMLLFGMAACGGGSGNGDDNNPGGNTSAEKSGTVTVSIPANASTQYAWEAMEYAYESLPGNENVDVKIETNTSSEDYTTKLLQSLTAGAQNVSADIVVANEAGQYLKTCFADYMPYLAKKNPYANNQIWRDTLEQAAYATYGADDELYMLSFDTTQVFIVYSKYAFAKAGITEVPQTWNELIAACDKLSKTESPSKGETYVPMSFGGSKSSMGMPLSWLIRIYSDQYFRDFAEIAHSADGDYTYDPDIDADWELSYALEDYEGTDVEKKQGAINNDNPFEYTSNPLRALNAYYEGTEYNPKGARWQDMINNLNLLLGNPDYLNDDLSQNYATALTNMYTNRAGMCVVASDFLLAYANQMGYTMDQVLEVLGIFYAPAMTAFDKNDPEAAPAADYTRSLGGPNGFFGVVNKNKAQTDLAMDFMMFVFSKQGQEVRLNNIAENNGSINGPLLVKDVEIPESLMGPLNALHEAAGGMYYYGESDYNPYFLVSSGLKAYNGMYEPHADDDIKELYWNFFIKKEIKTAQDLGAQIYAKMDAYKKQYFELLDYRDDCLSTPSKNPSK